jgi:hypothetical protein
MAKNKTLVHDRWYHFKIYKKCFVGKRAAEWLIEQGEATSVEDTIVIGRRMVAAGLMWHVTGDHDFQVDKKLFYRFSDAVTNTSKEKNMGSVRSTNHSMEKKAASPPRPPAIQIQPVMSASLVDHTPPSQPLPAANMSPAGSGNVRTPQDAQRRLDNLVQLGQSMEANPPSPSPTSKTRRLRNAGCFKERAGQDDSFGQDAAPILDELRSCQNCATKFFTNKTNVDTSGDFCSPECMWSAVLKAEGE